MESFRCGHCGFLNWETDVSCKRCGASVHQAEQAEDESGSAGNWSIKTLVLVVALAAVSVFGYRQWSASPAAAPPAESSVSGATSPGKKPLNTPGAEIVVSQYLSPGKNTIAYFYADW